MLLALFLLFSISGTVSVIHLDLEYIYSLRIKYMFFTIVLPVKLSEDIMSHMCELQ